jgi:hypothetical protein
VVDVNMAFSNGVFVGVILFMIFDAFLNGTPHDNYVRGFKDGQIECINGNIEYKLKEMPDHTTEWTKIPPRADHQNFKE